MDGDRIERDLQAALRTRDPGPAPTGLIERVALIPDREPSTQFGRARRTLSGIAQLAAAAIAVVAIFALILMWRSSPVPIDAGPGIGATPGTTIFDPTIDGAGVYMGSTGSEIVAIVIVALTVGLLAILRFRSRVLRGVAVGAVLAVVVGAVAVNNDGQLESTGIIWYSGVGAVLNTPPDDGTSGGGQRPTQVFVVEPNGILTFGFDIHNRGPFPLTVLGILPDRRNLAFGRFTAAGWMGGDDGISTVQPERFAPLTLQPGGYQVLSVAARSTPCAVARDTSRDASGASAGVEEIQVAYETLGIRKVATLQLPETVRISIDPECRRDVISSPAP